MDYKKLFRTRQSRERMLSLLRFVPDRWMLRLQYRIKTGRALHLKNPRRMTEKLQWYKLYYRDSVMHTCVDKYRVRDYVKSKGLEHILVKLYGKYDTADQIDWDALPDSFVLKATGGGGGLDVFLCPDKASADREAAMERLRLGNQSVKPHTGGREWAYYGLRSGIIAEELLVNPENPDAGVEDYKIFCYHGKPAYIVVDADRYIGHKRNFYDLDWNNLHIESDAPCVDRELAKPENLAQMLEIAAKLSEGFPFVRVDLYNVGGRIYFGELTFYPWSGYVRFTPDEADFLLGEKMILPEKKKTGGKR